MIEFILIVVGLFSGIVGSLIGLGGGVIVVPALFEFTECTPSMAVGTSTTLIMLGASASSVSYIRQKRIDFKKSLFFFLICSPGSLLGSVLTPYFQTKSFFICFGVMMFLLLLLLLLETSKNRSFQINIDTHPIYLVMVGVLVFFIGIISGLFGLGGGVLLLPLMMFIGFSIHRATATSVFVILLTSIWGFLVHLYLDDIYWYAVLFLGPAMIMGSMLGAHFSSRLDGKTLLRLLHLILLAIAIDFICKGLNWV